MGPAEETAVGETPAAPAVTRSPEALADPRLTAPLGESREFSDAGSGLDHAAAADFGSAPAPVRQPPVSVRRLVVRFALAGIPALIAVIVITAIASVRIGTRLGIDDARRVSFVAATLVEEQGLDDGLLAGDPDSIAKVDDVVRTYVIRGYLVRVKLHSVEGVVLYSNDPRLIGQQFPVGEDEQRIIDGLTDVEAEVSDLSKEENTLETEGKLLEVYRRVATPDGTPVLFEAYFRYDDVRNTGRDLWRQFAPIAVGALLIVELVQIPIAISLARRLRQGQEQRERLLQHAIESSDAERRRIASDLHDGAVQELTGVSMSLIGGRAKVVRRPQPRRDGRRRIEDPRDGEVAAIDAGRHLPAEPLRGGSAECARRPARRGAQSGCRHTSGRGSGGRWAESRGSEPALPQRAGGVAQRGQPRLRDRGDGDGDRGLLGGDPRRRRRRCGLRSRSAGESGPRGHVGLRSLAGLVHDAGGRIEVRSLPGVGTRVEVAVPR